MYEKVSLVGWISRAEKKVSEKTGASYIEIVMGVDRLVAKDTEETIWWKVMLSGSLYPAAEQMLPYYAKGRQILVEGRPIIAPFVKRDNELSVSYRCMASGLPLLLDKKREQSD